MKTTLLLDIHAGYEVMAWIAKNKAQLIRCVFTTKGAKVCYLA